MTGDKYMLNQELFEDKKDAEIARLKMAIENFKKYDNERKEYYAKSIRRLGELESFVQEIEYEQPDKAKILRYKERLSYLEQIIRAKNIQENISLEEAHDLINNKMYKEKYKELQIRISELAKNVSRLASENIYLKERIKELTDKQ